MGTGTTALNDVAGLFAVAKIERGSGSRDPGKPKCLLLMADELAVLTGQGGCSKSPGNWVGPPGYLDSNLVALALNQFLARDSST